MSKLSLFTIAALGMCISRHPAFAAADTGGSSGGAGGEEKKFSGGEPANKVNPLNDPTGTASTRIGPSRHRLVVVFSTVGDPEKIAKDILELIEGEGVTVDSGTLQTSGYADRNLKAAPVESGTAGAEGASGPVDPGAEPDEETETAEQLVEGNSKEELLAIAEEEEVEDVDDRHTKAEIAAAIVGKREQVAKEAKQQPPRNPGDGQK